MNTTIQTTRAQKTFRTILTMCMTTMSLLMGQAQATETMTTKGKILMVAANKTQANNGWPLGVWAAELSHPYDELTHAGYTVDIASPEGGNLFIDPYSDPRHESGYSTNDITSLGFLSSPKTAELLNNTPSLASIDAKDYAAIIVAGGQSPMYTFRGNTRLQNLITQFYESGKPTAALCHGVAALVDTRLSNGRYLIKGKRVTGFSLNEDQFVEQTLKTKIFDWYVEPAMKARGANYVQGGMWADFAVADKNLITGQQQHSGRSVARLVIKQLQHKR